MPFHISVIGTGYLGATHAAALAEQGFDVLGLDADPRKVAKLRAGVVPFYEPGLPELMARHVSTGRLRFTTSWAEVGDFADVHYLCVGTPEREEGRGADLTFLEAAVDALAPHLHRRCLVVGKSTVPVGTAKGLAVRMSERAPAGSHVEMAWNPEFLREGSAVSDTLRPDRIVVGVQSDVAEKILRELHVAQVDDGVPMLVTDLATAELIKIAANGFLATRVSFMNAMAELCEATGADVVDLREAMGHDRRIGPRYLDAGLGFGGGCLPKDIRTLKAQAERLDLDGTAALIGAVDAINVGARARMVDLVREECEGAIEGRRIAVLGVSFKPNSDDIRDSPALGVAVTLERQGATVCVYDPVAVPNARRAFPQLRFAGSAVDAAKGADVVLHLTEWSEFQDLEPRILDPVVARKSMIDGRNVLDPERWRNAGWTYRGLGRS